LEIPVVANNSDVCSRTTCLNYARGKTQEPCLTDEEARKCCEEEVKTFLNRLTWDECALISIGMVVVSFCLTSLLCCLCRRILCCCN